MIQQSLKRIVLSSRTCYGQIKKPAHIADLVFYFSCYQVIVKYVPIKTTVQCPDDQMVKLSVSHAVQSTCAGLIPLATFCSNVGNLLRFVLSTFCLLST